MSNFEVGDRVQWTHISRERGGLSMDTRYGEIVAIEDTKAKIRPDGLKSNGSKKATTTIALSRLRSLDQKSAVNDFVQRVFQRNRR
jgi:hypothetical protein